MPCGWRCGARLTPGGGEFKSTPRLTDVWEYTLAVPFRKSGRMRKNGMEFYLSCEICLLLWAEYGAATIELRAGAVRPEREAAGARGRLEDALKAMREREAEAHHKPHANASGS